jgi:hypothetical protein
MRAVIADFRGRELDSHAAGPHHPGRQYQAGILKAIDVEPIHRELIAPALDAAGLGGKFLGPGNIREDMFSLILEADLGICAITVYNGNVFYELGIRHSATT